MTKLSEKLANASVKDAPKLLEELREGVWQYHRDPDGVAFDKFNTLIAIGPEGWLSAVMMLVPEGWGWRIISDDSAFVYQHKYRSSGRFKIIYGCVIRDRHPALALALASAIAQITENDDA